METTITMYHKKSTKHKEVFEATDPNALVGNVYVQKTPDLDKNQPIQITITQEV